MSSTIATTSASPAAAPSQPTPAPAAPAPVGTASDAAKDAPAPNPIDERHNKAQSIVHRNVLWALGIGLVPLPIVDFIGVTGVQLKMLRELAGLYDAKFSEQLAKKIIASLAAGLGSAGIGAALGISLFKFVPLIGTSLGALSLPVLGGAFTLAVGRVFVAHFESGGTILDFNAKAIREHFRKEFEQAKQAVTQMKKDAPEKSPAAKV